MGRNKYIYVLAKSSVVTYSGLKDGTWEGAKENLKNNWTDIFIKKNEILNCLLWAGLNCQI
jgi:hypothetical protein